MDGIKSNEQNKSKGVGPLYLQNKFEAISRKLSQINIVVKDEGIHVSLLLHEKVVKTHPLTELICSFDCRPDCMHLV